MLQNMKNPLPTAEEISKYFLEDNNQKMLTILKGLDVLKNAISIFDHNGTLLFANKSFCSNFAIDNLDAEIGKSIKEIAKEKNIEVTSTGSRLNNWRMFEVLETGKEILNWETRLDRNGTNQAPLFISNDMYPLFDNYGNVTGLIEISRHREQDMNLIKKVIGLKANYVFDDIIGSSPSIQDCINIAKKYACSTYNILITGESGVGKELFAQSIHNYSPRRNGPFIALNCATLPENLIESELFGYASGAFTGASKGGQPGKFELANGGTIFLDEIGELPYHFQSKLLRVLETWTVTRVGGTKPTPIDVRLIAATNRDLKKMVEDNLFRQDLYYRIQVLNIEVPPLRTRKEDLLDLSAHFLSASVPSADYPQKALSAESKETLLRYDWPGNVRELKNVINRVSVISEENLISNEDLQSAIGISPCFEKQSLTLPDDGENTLTAIRNRIDRDYTLLLCKALELSGGNKSKAAELLSISRKTLYRMIEKYNL